MDLSAQNTAGHRAATIGMFDGVHTGHRHLIGTLLRANTSVLPPVAVTFSDHPLLTLRPDKAPMLLTPPAEKERLLRELGTEPCIMTFDSKLASMAAMEFMSLLVDRFGIDRLVLGFNNRFGHDTSLGFDDYRLLGLRLGIEVISAGELPSSTTVSSSAIRERLLEGNVTEASSMLARPYSLSGTIEHGKRIGSTIGFPTANLHLSFPRQLVPASGVYAADVILPDGTRHIAAVNIGYRPTVDTSANPAKTIEAHLPGFKGDLYGKKMTVEFIRRIRGERKFDSLDSLRQQLAADISSLGDTDTLNTNNKLF